MPIFGSEITLPDKIFPSDDFYSTTTPPAAAADSECI